MLLDCRTLTSLAETSVSDGLVIVRWRAVLDWRTSMARRLGGRGGFTATQLP